MNDFILDKKITPPLLRWYGANARDLPWRHSREPYRVWLSEIMLQQTRVDTVIPYYQRFLLKAPDIPALAALEEERLLKLWEGLGYYSRARNLQKAARLIMERYVGRFPEQHTDIRALPGIGDYTAGAIASICFNQPTPAVDGNVLRVAARLTRTANVDTPAAKRAVSAALAAVYPEENRGDFTQALMELGAVVCLPNGPPLCGGCPLAELCAARQAGDMSAYPAKKEKPARKAQDMTVFVLTCGNEVALQKRRDDGLLAGLWQLPNVPGLLDEQAALDTVRAWGAEPLSVAERTTHKHIFTHIEWRMRCYRISCGAKADAFAWASAEQIGGQYALPTAFRKCL